MATYVQIDPTQKLDPFKAVKKVPLDEYFTSGHRTCQGCESALLMKMMAKAAGPRTIVLGSTGCMYVANTTYYSTAWCFLGCTPNWGAADRRRSAPPPR